jgi:hypothetical protein
VLDGTGAYNGYCVLLAAVAGFCLFFPFMKQAGRKGNGLKGTGYRK